MWGGERTRDLLKDSRFFEIFTYKYLRSNTSKFRNYIRIEYRF
jgi:hypothetical protein